MPVYSYSRINTFENCPLQYRYRYIDRIKRDVQGIEAFTGKLVHAVLEGLYGDLERSRAAGARHFQEIFRDLWRRRYTPEVKIVRENMSVEDYIALGERCIQTFYEQNHPFDSGDVIGRETRVDFKLDQEGRYKMLGFIDRLDRVGPGTIEIHDYKTGSLPRAGAIKKDRQLTLYEIAVRQRYPDAEEIRHVWHYLAHGKRFEERREPDYVQKTRVTTIRAIQNIEATVDFPARTSALCSWCDYRDICPEWAEVRPGEPAAASPPEPVTRKPAPALEAGTNQYLLFGGAGEK